MSLKLLGRGEPTPNPAQQGGTQSPEGGEDPRASWESQDQPRLKVEPLFSIKTLQSTSQKCFPPLAGSGDTPFRKESISFSLPLSLTSISLLSLHHAFLYPIHSYIQPILQSGSALVT